MTMKDIRPDISLAEPGPGLQDTAAELLEIVQRMLQLPGVAVDISRTHMRPACAWGDGGAVYDSPTLYEAAVTAVSKATQK